MRFCRQGCASQASRTERETLSSILRRNHHLGNCIIHLEMFLLDAPWNWDEWCQGAKRKKEIRLHSRFIFLQINRVYSNNNKNNKNQKVLGTGIWKETKETLYFFAHFNITNRSENSGITLLKVGWGEQTCLALFAQITQAGKGPAPQQCKIVSQAALPSCRLQGQAGRSWCTLLGSSACPDYTSFCSHHRR